MFCTKCGKELYEGDRFCGFCGAEVRNRIASKNDEIVFNPPFKLEAQKKTEEILKAVEERKEEAARRETIAFNWNLEGFPAAQPKRTEDVDFNWDSVLERRNKNQPQPRHAEQNLPEKTAEKTFAAAEPEIPEEPAGAVQFETPQQPVMAPKFEIPRQPAGEDDEMSVEELEKQIFGDAERSEDDKFFTFNRKNNEFQKLLDKEKERVQNMEAEYNRQFAEMDYTWVPEVFPVKYKSAQKEEPKKAAEKAPEAVLIGVTQPVTPNTVDFTVESISAQNESAQSDRALSALSKDAPSESAPSESATSKSTPSENKVTGGNSEDATPSESATAENTPSESDRLRYSDIFPRVDVQSNCGSVADYDYYENHEEPVKKHIALKILIAILLIALAVEGAVLAIKFFAPESKASGLIDDVTFKVVDLFTGSREEENNENTEGGDEDIMGAYMANIVTEKSANVNTIGSVIYNPELVYDGNKTYSFEEISSADEFVDGQWEGMNATYGEKLLETLIKHYDRWLSTNTDESLVGINTLEIGEIKTGQNGFYTLCKVTFAKADGSETSTVQTVYTVISGELMVINEIKEESV